MKKTILVNLNFDDFHPEDDTWGDFGGTVDSGVFKRLSDITTQFPGLVVTLFTTPNWIDRPYAAHRYWYALREKLGLRPVVSPQAGEPFKLTKHRAWCEAVQKLVAEKRFEIAVHGYLHTNPASRIHGQEFAGIAREETLAKIRSAESELSAAGIPFIKAFRPPGWGENPYLAAALKETGYEIFARDSSHAKTSSMGTCEGMKTIPQNWSIRESTEEALRLAEETGVVFMKGHLVYQYGKETIENGITDAFWTTLVETLSSLTQQYDVQFVSLEEYLRRQT